MKQFKDNPLMTFKEAIENSTEPVGGRVYDAFMGHLANQPISHWTRSELLKCRNMGIKSIQIFEEKTGIEIPR